MIAQLEKPVSAEDYHRRLLGVASKTALDKIARSPAHYRAWLDEPDEPTPAMVFGSLVHQYVFELPKCLASVVVVPDFGDCRTKANKERRDAWRAEHADKTHVEHADWDACRRMGDAVQKHPIASKLIATCEPEKAIYWPDAETGLQCKARVDGWCPALRMALDLKTTADASPEGFAKSVANFRYHVQAAFYTYGLGEAVAPVKAFLFIAVEKEPPYAVATYNLDSISMDKGEQLYRRDLATLKRCVDADEWPAFGDSTISLTLPRWA